MDGQRQRNALTAAERALRALGGGDIEHARRAADRARELDQVGQYALLPEAVELAANDLEAGGRIGLDAIAAVRAAVGDGPLQGLVDEIGGSSPP